MKVAEQPIIVEFTEREAYILERICIFNVSIPKMVETDTKNFVKKDGKLKASEVADFLNELRGVIRKTLMA